MDERWFVIIPEKFIINLEQKIMTNLCQFPTPYPDVNEILQLLLARVQEVLGQQFYGLYLYGSLASGGFDSRRSDIDFLVVTQGLLPEDTIAALQEMHRQLWSNGGKWAGKLEGAYLPRELLRKLEPDGPKIPQVSEGRFYLETLGSDWVIQYHILREYGAVVEGPSLRELIEPVKPQTLRAAVRQVLEAWWLPMLADPHWLERSEYQAYAVLTMCRAMYTLREGRFVSKSAAAHWARNALGPKWTGLIDWAESWPEAQSDRLAEVLELVRYTLEASGVATSNSK